MNGSSSKTPTHGLTSIDQQAKIIKSSALSEHWMLTRRLPKSYDRKEGNKRKTQANPYFDDDNNHVFKSFYIYIYQKYLIQCLCTYLSIFHDIYIYIYIYIYMCVCVCVCVCTSVIFIDSMMELFLCIVYI